MACIITQFAGRLAENTSARIYVLDSVLNHFELRGLQRHTRQTQGHLNIYGRAMNLSPISRSVNTIMDDTTAVFN